MNFLDVDNLAATRGTGAESKEPSMSDAIPATQPQQQSLPGVYAVTTRDKRFRILFPLPPVKSTVKPIPAGNRRASTVLRDMNHWLNQGHAVRCPLTGKLIRIYRRGLHRSQVTTLRRLRQTHQDTGTDYAHLRQFTARRDGDLSKLLHWGLIEPKTSEVGPHRDRGFWRITPKGRLWLLDAITIPRQIALLNGEFLGFVDHRDQITTADVESDFNQETLIAGKDGLEVTHAG